MEKHLKSNPYDTLNEDLGWDIGRPEWGAVPGKVCFVIKLGRRLK